MPDQVSPKLTNLESIFKSLVWDRAIDAGFISLFAAAPYLAVWPLGKLLRDLANVVGNYLFSSFSMFVDVSFIKLKNSEMQTAYDKASVTLMVIAHDRGIESEAFKNARDAAKIALSRFANISH